MRLRVIGGTPNHEQTLCLTCSNRQYRRGVRYDDDFHGCDTYHGRIPQPVVECSEYADNRWRVPMEATKQAWRWVPSLGTFLAPEEWERAHHRKALANSDY